MSLTKLSKEMALKVISSYRVTSSLKKAREYLEFSEYEPGHLFSITVDDVSFKMSFSDYRLGATIIERIKGRREPETTAIIKSIVQPTDKVLQLGACYGYFTHLLASCAGPQGKVVAIEGTPRNFQILQENIRINGLNNVEIHNVFIATHCQSKSAQFNRDDHHPYNAIKALKQPGEEKSGKVSVPIVKLSSFLEEINFQPDKIFMDIEGFEIDVLEDLSERWLHQLRPTLVFEAHPQFYSNGKDLNHILRLLREQRYRYRKIAGNLVCFPE